MDNGFLITSLFFPRITLFWYYTHGWIPANTLPFWLDATCGILLPRALLLVYIAQNLGFESPWFIIHAVMTALSMTMTSRASQSND